MNAHRCQWRQLSEVPRRPTSALFAVFDDDGGPYLLEGIFIVSKGGWAREDGGPMPKNIDKVWWIEEEAVFRAWPLRPAKAA